MTITDLHCKIKFIYLAKESNFTIFKHWVLNYQIIIGPINIYKSLVNKKSFRFFDSKTISKIENTNTKYWVYVQSHRLQNFIMNIELVNFWDIEITNAFKACYSNVQIRKFVFFADASCTGLRKILKLIPLKKTIKFSNRSV